MLLAQGGQAELDRYCPPCPYFLLPAQGFLDLDCSGNVDLLELRVVFCEKSGNEEGLADHVSKRIELDEVESFEKLVGDAQVIIDGLLPYEDVVFEWLFLLQQLDLHLLAALRLNLNPSSRLCLLFSFLHVSFFFGRDCLLFRPGLLHIEHFLFSRTRFSPLLLALLPLTILLLLWLFFSGLYLT